MAIARANAKPIAAPSAADSHARRRRTRARNARSATTSGCTFVHSFFGDRFSPRATHPRLEREKRQDDNPEPPAVRRARVGVRRRPRDRIRSRSALPRGENVLRKRERLELATAARLATARVAPTRSASPTRGCRRRPTKRATADRALPRSPARRRPPAARWRRAPRPRPSCCRCRAVRSPPSPAAATASARRRAIRSTIHDSAGDEARRSKSRAPLESRFDDGDVAKVRRVQRKTNADGARRHDRGRHSRPFVGAGEALRDRIDARHHSTSARFDRRARTASTPMADIERAHRSIAAARSR